MDVTVRDAVEADAAAVARIYIDSWNGGFGELLGMRALDAHQVGRWAGELSAGVRRWWVAEREGEIVGFVGVGPSRDPVVPGLGELDTIAVQPSQWRTGVGRTLMDVALGSLAREYVGAVLWTVVGYDRGQRFYEAMGWESEGQTRADGRKCVSGIALDEQARCQVGLRSASGRAGDHDRARGVAHDVVGDRAEQCPL